MDYLGYVYAALLSIGGFVGYIKAGLCLTHNAGCIY